MMRHANNGAHSALTVHPHFWFGRHAAPFGEAAQSGARLQPHVPPARQAIPSGSLAQLLQANPSPPHAAGMRPGAHVPPLQQPPLQRVKGSQLVVQTDSGLQALNGGQSVVTLQPHPGAGNWRQV